MSAGHIDQCRSCRASIYWCTTDRDKPMPVDAWPDPDRGNVSIYPEKGQMRAVVVHRSQAEAMRARGLQLHTSHFSSCPNANQWRKKR